MGVASCNLTVVHFLHFRVRFLRVRIRLVQRNCALKYFRIQGFVHCFGELHNARCKNFRNYSFKLNITLIKNGINIPHIRKFKVEQLQSHI
jgi:hypothetical protein